MSIWWPQRALYVCTVEAWILGGMQTRRYQQFKGALEKLDSKLAGNSSLPIVYQWEHQMAGPVMK